MRSFIELLKILFGRSKDKMPIHYEYPTKEQQVLDDIVAKQVLPLPAYILSKIPLLNKCSYTSGCFLISTLPIALYFGLMLVSSELHEEVDITHLLFLTLFSFFGSYFVINRYESLRAQRFKFISMLKDTEECEQMIYYFRLGFNIRNQAIFSFLFGFYTLIQALLLGIRPTSIKASMFIVWWIWSYGTLIGNGIYWAICTPQVVKFLSESKHLLYDKFAPSETPGIRFLSPFLANTSLLVSVTVTAMVFSFFMITFPVGDDVPRIFGIATAIAGSLLSVYAFAYPQIRIIKLIFTLKEAFENELIQTQQELLSSDAPAESLNRIYQMLDRLRSSKNSPFPGLVIARYITSALIPFTGWFVERIDIINKLVDKIMS